MRTVLIVEDGVRATLRGFDLVLEDMKTKYDIAACRWVPSAADPQGVLPGIEELVEVDQPWRAVVLTDLSERTGADAGAGEEDEEDAFDNPFDFHANRAGVAPVHALAQMLGDMPEMYLQSVPQDDGTWLYEYEEPEDVSPQDGELERKRERFKVRRTFYAPSEEYHLTFDRPQELYLVTPRNVADGMLPQWQTECPLPDSLFWERNTYPSNARFFVFDRPQPPSAAYERSLEEMMLAVFQLCTVEFEAGENEAYALYALSVELNRERLDELANHRKDVCASVLRLIPVELERIKRHASSRDVCIRDVKELDETVSCDYKFEDTQDLYADKSHFGPAKDIPRSYRPDHREWQDQKNRIGEAFKELVKEPRRAVARSAERVAELRPADELLRKRMTRDQKEDVYDLLVEGEVALAAEHLDLNLDPKGFYAGIDKEDRGIRTILRRRPYVRQLLVCAAVVLCTFFLGFAPYVFGWAGGFGTNASAAAVSAICLAIVAAAGLAAVFWNYRSLRKWLNRFNMTMLETVDEVKNAGHRYAKHISAITTYRKRYASYAAQSDEGQATDATERIESVVHISALADAFDQEGSAWFESAGIGERESTARPLYGSWSEVLRAVRDGVFSRLFCGDFSGSCQMNGMRQVETPYDFIEGLHVKRLAVFEPERLRRPVVADEAGSPQDEFDGQDAPSNAEPDAGPADGMDAPDADSGETVPEGGQETKGDDV